METLFPKYLTSIYKALQS